MNNRERKVRQRTINKNINEPLFYPYSGKISKCSGSCYNINDTYAKLCVPNAIKSINVAVFSLKSRTSETSKCNCKCKCRLDASVCNNKKGWNNNKCRCECKKLIHM